MYTMYNIGSNELLQNLSVEALLLIILVPLIIYSVEFINYYNILSNLTK